MSDNIDDKLKLALAKMDRCVELLNQAAASSRSARSAVERLPWILVATAMITLMVMGAVLWVLRP